MKMIPLQLPVFRERLLFAMEQAQVSVPELRDRMNQLGVDRSKNYWYKLLDGRLAEPPRLVVAGCAVALGTTTRWFCELDLDGSLRADLVGRHSGRPTGEDSPGHPR